MHVFKCLKRVLISRFRWFIYFQMNVKESTRVENYSGVQFSTEYDSLSTVNTVYKSGVAKYEVIQKTVNVPI